MKKLLILVAAFCCLAACNKELGPEYKTYPVIETVTFNPTTVQPGEAVKVNARVTSEYGFTGISIVYCLNDDPATTAEPQDQIWWGKKNKTENTKNYTATLEGHKAGTKVSFQIIAVTTYNVLASSQVYEYTVQEEAAPEPAPDPAGN